MPRSRERVQFTWTPQWEGDVRTWTLHLIRKNKWRCDWVHDQEDLLQDCYMIFMRISEMYPRIMDDTSFKKLYKRACANKMNDRSCHKDRRKNLYQPTSRDVSELYTHHIGETTNAGYAMALLREAPEELKLALSIIGDHPEKLLELEDPTLRLNLNMKLRRILGLDTDFNFTECLRALFKQEDERAIS